MTIKKLTCGKSSFRTNLFDNSKGPDRTSLNMNKSSSSSSHDTTTTMPGPYLRRARHPERGGGTEAPQAFRRGEHMGRVGFDPRGFFLWDGRSPVSHPTCDVRYPARRTGEYRKGMISACPLYQGVRRSV